VCPYYIVFQLHKEGEKECVVGFTSGRAQREDYFRCRGRAGFITKKGKMGVRGEKGSII
jgi:hypothetical protein